LPAGLPAAAAKNVPGRRDLPAEDGAKGEKRAMVLTPSQARAFYDRFGKKQDWQFFYEDRAIDDLVAHAAFERAQSLFELGPGTGRLAERLLSEHLPASASYLGMDISGTMVGLATRRLSRYADRAKVIQSDGTMRFPLADRCVDRVVSTYVLDLLGEPDIRAFMAEAHRVLTPGGKLCLVSLTRGASAGSRLVIALWSAAFRLTASLVGGCRPIQLDSFLEPEGWSIAYRHVSAPLGVPSEALIATPRNGPDDTSGKGEKQGDRL
jgi:ubiquinone/menaquinone biosynthesis C-methylase UbiE